MRIDLVWQLYTCNGCIYSPQPQRPAILMEAQDRAVAVAISVENPPPNEIIWCFMFACSRQCKVTVRGNLIWIDLEAVDV